MVPENLKILVFFFKSAYRVVVRNADVPGPGRGAVRAHACSQWVGSLAVTAWPLEPRLLGGLTFS